MMSWLYVLIFMFLLFVSLSMSIGTLNRHRRRHPRNSNLLTSDYMMRIQCRARCLTDMYSTRECDYDGCLRDLQSSKKLGSCPRRKDSETIRNTLESNCVDMCGNWDYNCPATERCCPNSCGSSCQRPNDLDRIKALPPVPCKLSVTESRRKIEICWDVYAEIKNKTLFFVIEGRSAPGSVFASHKLSSWSIFHADLRYDHAVREGKKEIARRWCFILKRIKPGRWYQFRVASVNANGTRGFSRVSTEFQLKDVKGHKYPKSPRDLTIGPVHSDRSNASLLSATLTWKPFGNLPVDKYKIFWSRHLPGVINSLSMQHAIVIEPQRHFELRHLVPNSTYYIHVQSISVFGQKRLRSKKVSCSLNTTTVLPALSHLQVRHLTKAISSPLIRLRFLVSRTNELVVKVHWQHPINHTLFQLEICQGSVHCLDRMSKGGEYRVVNTTRSSFEFLNLNFDSVYSLRLKTFQSQRFGSEPKVAKTFMTPECKTFKQKFKIEMNNCKKI